MSEQLTQTVAFRVTEAERARLEAMAQATGRRPSGVLRRLLELAEPTGHPDLMLKARHDQAEGTK